MIEPPPAPPIEEPSPDDAASSLWMLALLAGAVAVVILVILDWLLGWGTGWVSNYWFNYEWPSDKGNGPEGITELIILGTFTAIVVPPVRRWFLAKFHHVKAEVEKVHETVKEHHEQAATERAEITHALHHIIRQHPDIDLMEGMEARPTDKVRAQTAPKPPAKPVPTKTTKKTAPRKKAPQ